MPSAISASLERLLTGLECAGVKKGARNKTVAEKTGYSLDAVKRVLSGNANLTERFILAVCASFEISVKWVHDGEQPVLFSEEKLFNPAIKSVILDHRRHILRDKQEFLNGPAKNESESNIYIDSEDEEYYLNLDEAHKSWIETVTAILNIASLAELRAIMQFSVKLIDNRKREL